jgi:hypothetical protein
MLFRFCSIKTERYLELGVNVETCVPVYYYTDASYASTSVICIQSTKNIGDKLISKKWLLEFRFGYGSGSELLAYSSGSPPNAGFSSSTIWELMICNCLEESRSLSTCGMNLLKISAPYAWLDDNDHICIAKMTAENRYRVTTILPHRPKLSKPFTPRHSFTAVPYYYIECRSDKRQS